MKKCPFCAEEIQDDAIKCRFCGEMLVKRKGRLLRCLGLIASMVIFIASLGYALVFWFGEHEDHGHSRQLFGDPAHLLSLILVVASALWTWRGLTRFRRNK